ncbi:MAG TPA: PstS family phosphate ABC transporter substrate-binding protein [Hyphomicrobiaceae bacterium]|nr:PstS family phosphate ABC transporter substrate-binding protein [Hyphomicrobiaceae bacterium]
MTSIARHTMRTAGLAGVALAALAAPLHAQPKTITLDGSSTVFPIMEAVAEEFQKSTKGANRVTVGISGTGGGFKKFCRGETDMSNGSRPILKEEIEACKKAGIGFIELPLAFDALTVVVHPSNPLTCIKVSELKTMWEPGAKGRITNWKQINPSFPDLALKLFGAGADSGTFDYFTEAAVGKAKSSRGDYTASEDDNVLVKGVQGDKGGIGYFGFAYYAANPKALKALEIDWGKGQGCVAPSLENVLAGKYNPMSRPLFVYVSSKAVEKPEVQSFVEFVLTKGPALIREVKYLPLPEAIYPTVLERFKARTPGSAFGGVPEVGVPIADLMKRKPTM